MIEQIRNFVIIAHIDHGKSTLADRFLELTGTVEARRMEPQYLDRLDLERERGITIKMAPVRMLWHSPSTNNESKTNLRIRKFSARGGSAFGGETNSLFADEYILNLIDTPGHSDFSYEVSRALAAVEGAILLVDATKGIQAQTLSNFRMARNSGLTIIGAINKVDLNPPDTEKIRGLLADLLNVPKEEIFRISGKTGEGVPELLEAIVEKIPAPRQLNEKSDMANVKNTSIKHSSFSKSLIFDSLYDDHKGIIAFVRVFDGEFKAGDDVQFVAADNELKVKEVGYFMPELKSAAKLSAGEMGYIVTGIKEPALVKIGDTILAYGKERIAYSKEQMANSRKPVAISHKLSAISQLALPGYKEPAPVVFVSFYPDGKTKFEDLKRAFERLRLTDSSLSFEPDSSEALGRGLKVGFLGQLHFEIAGSRLEREFGLSFLTSFPSIAYRVKVRGETKTVKDAHEFPDDPEAVFQPMINVEIFTPPAYMSQIMILKEPFYLEIGDIKNIGENVLIQAKMPLAELMRDFDDKLKSASAGFASFSYELAGEELADVEKLEILINDEPVPALTRIVFRAEAEKEGRASVERLKMLLPGQQFFQALQARVRGRIVARETIPALRKDVTGYLYGGDRTRKMKLWKKQKEGKKKLQESSRVSLSPEVFRELLKK